MTKFTNTTSDAIALAARLPVGIYAGSTISDSVGNIYYFGGSTRSTRNRVVYKFNPNTTQVTQVGELPLELSNAIKVDDSRVFLFGHTFLDHSSIVGFDLVSYESTIVGDLGYNCTKAPGIRYKDDLWILCSSTLNPTSTTMLRYNLINGVTTAVKSFPYLAETPSLVWDEESTPYITEGHQYPGDFVIKYDLEKPSDIHFIQVKMYPGNATYYYTGMGGVYVKKLNRIYLFGGLVSIPLFSGWKNDIHTH
ncbi:hypothetical protein Fcan01_26109 [Folsomia candida]|uniref:Uncharacterized protein n=2 Tax=Folsomia candida TaxID=158441 RepID=A0A226D0I7_FOLCA|nr:hypothetical protein Fcan01_26109 [Folsomia candida]